MSRDPDRYGDETTIDRLLGSTEVWAVVGLGPNAERSAYGVARVLQAKGKRIVPVHPRAATVHGEQGYATLADAVFAVGSIDVVDMFVNSRRVGDLVDQAIAVGARAVWLQVGVVDEAAAARARAAGLDVVMDACPKMELARRGQL